MANMVNVFKPSVCFEVEKIIAISTSGGNCKTYQVLWAPTWISGSHLVGCEDLIEQFESEQKNKETKIKIEVIEDIESETEEALICNGKDNDVGENGGGITDNLSEQGESNLLRFIEDAHDDDPSVPIQPNHSHFQNKSIEDNTSSILSSNSDTTEKDNKSNVFEVLPSESQTTCNDRTTPTGIPSTFASPLIYHSNVDNMLNVKMLNNKRFEYDNTRDRDTFLMNNAHVQKIRCLKGMFQCNVCNRKFASHVSLRRHINVHTAVKELYQCPFCPRKFASRGSLSKHEVIHRVRTITMAEQRIQTNEQVHHTMAEQRIQTNEQVHHNVVERSIQNNEKELIHTETGDKQSMQPSENDSTPSGENGLIQICENDPTQVCENNQIQDEVLQNGEEEDAIETGEERLIESAGEEANQIIKKVFIRDNHHLACKICKYQSTNNIQLLSHMENHKRRSYLCQICSKIFLAAADLKRHIRVHTGERPFECKFCFKRFKIKHHLQGHLRTHVHQEETLMCANV